MDQPSRKGVAAVAAARAGAAAPPRSPETILELDTESLDGSRKFAGSFKYRVPTLGDRVDISALKAQYLQQIASGIDELGESVAEALAYLNVTIDAKASPQWWRDSQGGIKLYDFQPLLVLYAQARAYEASFLGKHTIVPADEDPADAGSANAADGNVVADVPVAPQRRTVVASFGKGSSGADTDAEGDGEPEG